ncbi:MAG: hypothetical protein Q9191_007278 [Dirinaria sp. TL-2023a]
MRLMLLSITNDTLVQDVELAFPMESGVVALRDDYGLEWVSHQRSISVETANQLFYSLYVAMVRFWRVNNNRPVTQDISVSTGLYPNIMTRISAVGPPYKITPSLAAAVLWNMLSKYFVPQRDLKSWDLQVLTRTTPPQGVGYFASDILSPILAANSSSLASNSSSIQSSSVHSAAPDGRSFVASNDEITTHIDFRGAIAYSDPRALWLGAFVRWNLAILIPANSAAMARNNAHGNICKIHFASVSGVTLIMQANLVSAWLGTGPLDYGELLTGITMVLEVMMVTSQFESIDASIYKNGRRAATFSVTATYRYPASGSDSVSTA